MAIGKCNFVDKVEKMYRIELKSVAHDKRRLKIAKALKQEQQTELKINKLDRKLNRVRVNVNPFRRSPASPTNVCFSDDP